MKPLSAAYVHIGFEKTGSTSLYNTLVASRAGLSRNGVLFPEIAKVHVALPFALGADTASRRQRLGLEEPEMSEALARETLESLERQIATFEGGIVVISSEMLAGLPPAPLERLRELLATYAEMVKVVAYVRHPVAQAVSLAQQLIKSGGSTRAELEAGPKRRSYARRLAIHVSVFGRENVIVHVFEPKRLVGGRVQPDFFRTIGFEAPADALVTVDSNPSLSMPGAVLADLINQQAGRRPRTGHFIYSVPGGKFSLPAEALHDAEEKGREDVSYLRDMFGIELTRPTIAPRGPLASYFTDEVVAAIERIPSDVQLSRKAKLAFHTAMYAIEGRSFDAPRPVDVEAARRLVRKTVGHARPQ